MLKGQKLRRDFAWLAAALKGDGHDLIGKSLGVGLKCLQRWWRTVQIAIRRAFNILLVMGFIGIVLYFTYCWIWPESTVTLSGIVTYSDDHGNLLFAAIARIPDPLKLKDPVIACNMKGESGTTITTLEATVYERLPERKDVFLGTVSLGKIPPNRMLRPRVS